MTFMSRPWAGVKNKNTKVAIHKSLLKTIQISEKANAACHESIGKILCTIVPFDGLTGMLDQPPVTPIEKTQKCCGTSE